MIAGPGYKLMSFVLWLKIVVKLRVAAGELVTVDSPLLVRDNRGVLVPMTGDFMARRDTHYASLAGSKPLSTVEEEGLPWRRCGVGFIWRQSPMPCAIHRG